MRRLVWVIIFSGIVGQGALALTVTNGEVYSASVLEVLPSDPLRVSTGGKVIASHALVIGPGPPMSYFASATVTGEGSSIDTDGIYMYGRGSSLIVQNGGVVRSTSMSINGDQTEGIVYNDLINYTSVSGNGSLLDISGNLTIRSPDSPGAPGLPFDYPREIPAYLNVYSGGELAVGGEISIFNGSWLSLGSGGCLTVRGNFNGSMHGFAYNGGALSVEGQLSGLSTLEAGCRLETPDVLGDLTVHGTYAPGNSPADSVLDGALTIAPDGTLEMELGGNTLGTEYDRLTVTGLSELDGTLQLVLLDGFNPAYGDVFDLFDWQGGVSGEFNRTNAPTLSGGLEWDTSDLYNTGTISVIPEPSVASLLVVFSGGLWVIRRYFPSV